MTEFLIEQFSQMTEGMRYLMTFVISMFPIVELRGAVPVGIALGLDTFLVLLVSIIGNLLPIPFVIFKSTKILRKFGLWLEEKATKNVDKITKYEKLGLFLFVAIPLPGTGAWTGALIASLFDMRIKDSIIAISLGVITAGLIMTLGSEAVKFILTLF